MFRYRNHAVFAFGKRRKIALLGFDGAVVKIRKFPENFDPEPREIWENAWQSAARQRVYPQCFNLS
jgi:hypothetical protein